MIANRNSGNHASIVRVCWNPKSSFPIPCWNTITSSP